MLTRVAFILALLLSVSIVHAQDIDPCLKVRAALDIGSGSTKMRSAVVNVCTQVIVAEIARVKSIPLPFKDDMNRNKGSFSTDLLDKSETEISLAAQKLVNETRLKLLNEKSLAEYSILADSEIEVAGGATEAFRKAKNTNEFLSRVNKFASISVLTQKQEGHLGFIGVLVKIAQNKGNAEPTKTVSWDIGGGSMQIVNYKGAADTIEQSWNDFGNLLASNPMREFIVSEVQHRPLVTDDKKATSPNPLVDPNGQGYGDYARVDQSKADLFEKTRSFTLLNMKDLLEAGWLKALAQDGSAKVYGIGGVHGGVLALLRTQTGFEKASGYSAADLRNLLDKTLMASDKQIHEVFGVDEQYAMGAVSNVLMVYQTMEVMGIDRVEVLDVDNTQGLLVSPTFWKPVPFAESAHKMIQP